jgi:spermidine/putrescine transport system permease protein
VIKQQFVESRDWPFGSVLSMVLTAAAVLVVLLGAKFGQQLGHSR